MLECRDLFNGNRCCNCSCCPSRMNQLKPYQCCQMGSAGRFLSSYIEAVGSAQSVGSRGNIIFDNDREALDVAGRDIMIDASGAIFTINRAGLYHVEWSVNLRNGTQPILFCLMENGEPSSPMSNINSTGNYSSGALINVSQTPFTISLHNFGGPIELIDQQGFANTAASIRILRFANGPD